MNRCKWVNLNNLEYVNYHDNEWGVPQHDDNKLFEFLLLECFQAGLSWQCVLNKRKSFFAAFDGFDAQKIANYGSKKVQQLLQNPQIIRNKLKILAAINNAQVFLKIKQEFKTFNNYIWGFVGNKVVFEEYCLRTTSPLSNQISKDLIARGMKFVGSTTIYAYLQAIGVINAHGKECFKFKNKL